MSLAEQLCSFINASPSPFHVVDTVVSQLTEAGFTEIYEAEAWPSEPGRFVVRRGGSVIAYDSRGVSEGHAGFAILGGHTDSPNLRLKENVDLRFGGVQQLALEPYGSPILSTWFDRPLGVSGRVVNLDGTEYLVHSDDPIVTVPNLAIHLTERGKPAEINAQNDLNGVLSLQNGSFKDWLAGQIGIAASEIAGWDLMTHDIQGAVVVGLNAELISSPRLDNQATCFSAIQALISGPESAEHVRMVALFDHEEVGSASERGAGSPLLATVMERIVGAHGGTRDDLHRAMAESFVVSADMAHATHPNQASRHEPNHTIALGGGPVLKMNYNLRYASDGRGAALVQRASNAVDVPLQRYVHRADLPCGSTIGPITAANTGLMTVDIGAPMLAMHSARELMAVEDLESYVRCLTALIK